MKTVSFTLAVLLVVVACCHAAPTTFEDDDDDIAALEALLQTAHAQSWGSVGDFFKKAGKIAAPILNTGTRVALNPFGKAKNLLSYLINQIPGPQAQDDDDNDIAALEALLQTADAQSWGSIGKNFKKAGKKAAPVLKTGSKVALNPVQTPTYLIHDQISGPQDDDDDDIAALEALLQTADAQSWGSLGKVFKKARKI